MLQGVRRFLVDAESVSDIAGVDPALREPSGRERPAGQLPGDPGDAPVRIARREARREGRPRRFATARTAPSSGKPRSRSTIAAAPSSTLPCRSRPPASTSMPSVKRSCVLASASSSVWARWSTTSATLHPSQRVGRCQPDPSSGSSRAASSECCSSSAVRIACMGTSMAHAPEPGALEKVATTSDRRSLGFVRHA